jgi:hypothetical protein
MTGSSSFCYFMTGSSSLFTCYTMLYVQFGSGWAWLVSDSAGKLSISKTPNAVLPVVEGKTALLTCDVWEVRTIGPGSRCMIIDQIASAYYYWCKMWYDADVPWGCNIHTFFAPCHLSHPIHGKLTSVVALLTAKHAYYSNSLLL